VAALVGAAAVLDASPEGVVLGTVIGLAGEPAGTATTVAGLGAPAIELLHEVTNSRAHSTAAQRLNMIEVFHRGTTIAVS
jgi:hypothetical protein